MKNRYILAFLFVLALPLGAAHAQETYEGTITYEQLSSRKSGDQLLMDVKIDLSELTLKRQQMVTLTPLLTAMDRTATYRFEPVVITGSRREKAINRAVALGNFEFEFPPQIQVRRYNKEEQEVMLELAIPYAPWMRNAELLMNEVVSGCVNCDVSQNDFRIIYPVLPPVFTPAFQASFVAPPAEEIKQRSETYAARLNFQVNRYEVLRNFQNNAQVLADVDKIIKEIQADENLTITNFKVTGYASPEGNFDSNMKLSENRAKSFVTYLKNTYKIKDSEIYVDWKGEDWEGLRSVIAASDIADRDQILHLIDTEADIVTRENKIKALSNGTTYKRMLEEFYPPLRRNDYTIGYVSRAFNLAEAKELVKTKPHHLSLNEMYLVANTYDKESREFKEIFSTALRLFPNDPYARLNASALEIEDGAYDAAASRLEGIEMPDAWNNLGIAMYYKGEYQRAAELFTKARDAGSQAAVRNLEQLNRWFEDR